MTDLIARLLPLGLVLLMFVVGLRLSPARLARAFAEPSALMLGLAVQWLGLPLLALGIAAMLGLPDTMRAGLILIALAPGGVTSNYVAYVARADLALSMSMTLVTTVLAGVTIPLGLALTGAVTLPDPGSLLSISAKMSAVAVLPAALGLSVAAFLPDVASRLLKRLDPAARLVFLLLVLATFYQNRAAMAAHLSTVGAAVIGLNLGALALAAAAGSVTRLRRDRVRAVMVEASLQNVALAMFVAGAVLGEPSLSVPALIYAVVMNVSALFQILCAGVGGRVPVRG